MLAIQIRVKRILERLRRIIEPHLLIQRINLLDILRLKVKVALEIRQDSGLGLALGNHLSIDAVSIASTRSLANNQMNAYASAMRNAPRESDLRSRLAVFLPNLCQHRIVDQFPHVLAFGVDGVLVAEGRVLRDVDAVLLVKCVEAVLLEIGMSVGIISVLVFEAGLASILQLHLMSCGNDARLLQQPLHLGP